MTIKIGQLVLTLKRPIFKIPEKWHWLHSWDIMDREWNHREFMRETGFLKGLVS